MQRFTDLYFQLDATTKTSTKVAALERYFREAGPADAAWALYFLTGHRLRRVVSGSVLRLWASERSGLPLWLVEECHATVGDLAETLALVLPENPGGLNVPLHQFVENSIVCLAGQTEAERRATIEDRWAVLSIRERLVWHKLITGEFRVGISSTLVARALAHVADIPPAVMAHRLMGQWSPTPRDYERILGHGGTADPAQPYPFCLAYPLEPDVAERVGHGDVSAELGDVQDWQFEWKWDGIRAQLLRRGNDVMLWSRGEDLVTHRFPEITEAARRLPPGSVLDGEILAWGPHGVRPFGHLQRRLGRKTIDAKLLSEVPVVFLAYDLLEDKGEDIRSLAMEVRRSRLETLLSTAAVEGRLQISPLITAMSWAEVRKAYGEARERSTEGLMLKRRGSAFGVGRQRGLWWKWKTAPFEMDAVLMYAQGGHGRRAGLFTDYTFGVWSGDTLVPVAKAYSGLTDAEIRSVDAFIRRNTLERHGPVRVVKPELVFQLAFEGIQSSNRHKSGVAVRFPRMARWRQDKKASEADTLDFLKRLLGAVESGRTVAP